MIVWSQLNNAEREQALSRPAMADSAALSKTVADIIAAVQKDGDEALKAMAEKFDGVSLSTLRLEQGELDNAESEITPAVKSAIDMAFDNILAFHQAQKPKDIRIDTQPGVTCELKHAALSSVGLYIPGGTAPLPSTVLMLGIPAMVAGCKTRILCTPPGKDGRIAAEIRYAAKRCGITDVFLSGGAQAVAAMALGTESVPKVDKIYGPGNSFVTEAKQQVSQMAGGAAIDMPAGPSEVLVLADADANPVFVAADLLSQAEHGTDSQAVMVCESETLIAKVQVEVERQLQTLSRNEIATKAMQHSRYILTESVAESVEVSNAYAPEHLIVQTAEASSLLPVLDNAGSIFVGQWSPESAGDYASGTNHVLPTYGYARNYSSLGLLDFMRRFTVQELTREGLETIGSAIMDLADAEGLDAHRQAVALRLQQGGDA